jgi:predicted small metal-binding protein
LNSFIFFNPRSSSNFDAEAIAIYGANVLNKTVMHLKWKHKMDEVSEVSLERVEKIIDGFGLDDFSTVGVIREYCGGFFSNK